MHQLRKQLVAGLTCVTNIFCICICILQKKEKLARALNRVVVERTDPEIDFHLARFIGLATYRQRVT